MEKCDTPRMNAAVEDEQRGHPKGNRVFEVGCALERELAAKAEECEALRNGAERTRRGLELALDALVINSGNIGPIRYSLLLPIDCEWNTWVRDLTAERENQPPTHPDDLRAAIDAAREGK